MQHIHGREYLGSHDTVIVNCEYRCNVLVMDDGNYSIYKNGGTFRYHGGHFDRFPVRIPVPSTDYWNVVIDFGGDWPRSGFRYGIEYLKQT